MDDACRIRPLFGSASLTSYFMMAIRNPLDLPEIREVVTTFLTTRDLARCARVCKNWHTVFLPYLWSTVDVQPKHTQPNQETLQGYRGHVRKLIYQGKVPHDHRSLQFPALKTLHISNATIEDVEMVGNQPSLTHLKLTSRLYNKMTWDPPAGLSNLTSLNLARVIVDPQDKNTTWNLLSQLETLELCYASMPTLPESMTGSWKIKDLKLESVRGVDSKEQLRWIEHCTHLKRLTWIPFDVFMGNLTEQFAQSAAANTWPELEELYYPYFEVSDRQASLIISGMRRVLSLTINFTQPFHLVKTALRHHFPWLRALELVKACDNDADFILEILKSCPQLESIQVGTIKVNDMLHDHAPWACENSLKLMRIDFKFEDDVVAAEQMVLFERISKLHNLKKLVLSTLTSVVQSLDLCLESGLKQLVTLTQLEELYFDKTFQQMTMKEVEWMIKHWKNLRIIRGPFNVCDDAETTRMIVRFQQAGISAESLPLVFYNA